MKEKDKKPLLSMPEVEESVKKRMDELYNPIPNIKLLKQQVYMENWIYFKTEDGESRGSMEFLPVPFYKGMRVKLHGYDKSFFKVVDWYLDNTNELDNRGLIVTVE